MKTWTHYNENCSDCAHCVPAVGICKRKDRKMVYEARLCDEERAPFRWWEILLFLFLARRCGASARFFKKYPKESIE